MANKVIVVVDDEPHIVEMVKTFLSIKGYDVHGAYTGESGLAIVESEHPDALLLDLMLPDMEGFEVCERLRASEQFADLPILIISARSDVASRERAKAAGADVYFTKPVPMPELIAELNRVLR